MKIMTLLLLLLVTVFAKDVSTKPFEALAVFKQGGIMVERAFDRDSIYQLQLSQMTPEGKRYFEVYITKDKKILIGGNGVLLETGAPLGFPLDMATLKKEADFVYGTGKKALVVMTDPECKYCIAFEKRWESLASTYTFYVYFYPLSFHTQATKMSTYVMHQKGDENKAKALLESSNGDTKYQYLELTKEDKERYETKLKANKALGDRLGVRGTPAVFDAQGNLQNWSQLR